MAVLSHLQYLCLSWRPGLDAICRGVQLNWYADPGMIFLSLHLLPISERLVCPEPLVFVISVSCVG